MGKWPNRKATCPTYRGVRFSSPRKPHNSMCGISTHVKTNTCVCTLSLSLSRSRSFFFPLDILPNNVSCCIVGISTLSAGPRTISLVLIGKCVTENWKKIFKVLRRRRRKKKKKRSLSNAGSLERGGPLSRGMHRPAPPRSHQVTLHADQAQPSITSFHPTTPFLWKAETSSGWVRIRGRGGTR